MNRCFLLSSILIILLQVSSCKKDSQPAQQIHAQQNNTSLEKGLMDFSINGELLAASVDTIANIITVIVPDSINQHALTVNVTLASEVTAVLNNISINSSAVYDFTKPVMLTVTSANKQRSTSFTIAIETEMQYIGIDGTLIAKKSLNKNYNYYFDQMDGSEYQSINCAPTVATMAIKWADPTFTGTPAYARSQIPLGGQLWESTDIKIYLNENNVNTAVDTLKNIDSLVKTNIDNNQLIVFCLYIGIVPLNDISWQHVSRFYYATGDAVHCILVKGYLQTSKTFYLEVYDPLSNNEYYTGLDYDQIKGKDRYYRDSDVYVGAKYFEGTVIVAATKGQKVMAAAHQLNTNIANKPKHLMAK
jgi:hypothetical protein